MSALRHFLQNGCRCNTFRLHSSQIKALSILCTQTSELKPRICSSLLLTDTTNVPYRHFDTTTAVAEEKVSFLKRLTKYGRKKPLAFSNAILLLSGFNLYTCIKDQIDFSYCIEEFKIADTFQSYYVLNVMHIWICMVKLTTLGEEGKLITDSLVKALWQDVEHKALLIAKSADVRKAMSQYNDSIRGILYAFDEGLLGDDKMLAGAVWRIFYNKQDVDPDMLALMVGYIRKQVAHVEKQDSLLFMGQGLVTFLPLYRQVENKDQRHAMMAKLMEDKF